MTTGGGGSGNATSPDALSALELISPILAGWCGALLVPVIHLFSCVDARVRMCCERLRDLDKSFSAHMLERSQRTVPMTYNAAADGGSGSDSDGVGCLPMSPTAAAAAAAAAVAAVKGGRTSGGSSVVSVGFYDDDEEEDDSPLPMPPGLQQEWLKACARLRYALSEVSLVCVCVCWVFCGALLDVCVVCMLRCRLCASGWPASM